MVESIFSKIEQCDILVADLSIINAGSNGRLTPNPNVLLEVGFAAKAISWTNIVCVYNCEYGKVEDLPFDIRTRKPIIYNTTNGNSESKNAITKALKNQLTSIILNRIIDKKEYLSTKRTIDLSIQSILVDMCRIIFDLDSNDKYNYGKLLQMSTESLIKLLLHKQFLGFFLFRNIETNIDEFVEFFNDSLETYFLNDKEKRLLAKLVFSLRDYQKYLHSENVMTSVASKTEFVIQSGNAINSNNPENSYLLLKPLDNNKSVVVAGGSFCNVSPKEMTKTFEIKEEAVSVFAHKISNIIELVNDWISITGNYFIVNLKSLNNPKKIL